MESSRECSLHASQPTHRPFYSRKAVPWGGALGSKSDGQGGAGLHLQHQEGVWCGAAQLTQKTTRPGAVPRNPRKLGR